MVFRLNGGGDATPVGGVDRPAVVVVVPVPVLVPVAVPVAGVAVVAPELEPQVPQDVDALQGPPGRRLAELGAYVAQLGVVGQGAAGDGADRADLGVAEQAAQQAGAQVACAAGQPDVDRTTSKARSASSM